MFLCLGVSEGLKEKGQGKLSHSDLSKIKQVAMETTLFIYSVYSLFLLRSWPLTFSTKPCSFSVILRSLTVPLLLPTALPQPNLPPSSQLPLPSQLSLDTTFSGNAFYKHHHPLTRVIPISLRVVPALTFFITIQCMSL